MELIVKTPHINIEQGIDASKISECYIIDILKKEKMVNESLKGFDITNFINSLGEPYIVIYIVSNDEDLNEEGDISTIPKYLVGVHMTNKVDMNGTEFITIEKISALTDREMKAIKTILT